MTATELFAIYEAQKGGGRTLAEMPPDIQILWTYLAKCPSHAAIDLIHLLFADGQAMAQRVAQVEQE
jgi:hypothetical protein